MSDIPGWLERIRKKNELKVANILEHVDNEIIEENVTKERVASFIYGSPLSEEFIFKSLVLHTDMSEEEVEDIMREAKELAEKSKNVNFNLNN